MGLFPNPCTFAACESPIPFPGAPILHSMPTINGMPAPAHHLASPRYSETAPLELLSTPRGNCIATSMQCQQNEYLIWGNYRNALTEMECGKQEKGADFNGCVHFLVTAPVPLPIIPLLPL